MCKLLINRDLLMSPPDAPAGGAGVVTPPMDKEDIIKFLGEDDDKEVIPLKDDDKETPPKDKESKEDKEDKEEVKVEGEDDDELKELEEELEGPTDEQLELATPVRRKEILAKYPKLFQDFPYLEKAYYREQQFTELLPTIEDAKEAVEKSKTLDNFEADLAAGNTEKMLLAAKEAGPKAFNKIVDDYMVVLSRVDEKAYHHVIQTTIKHTILAMVNEGRASQNDALQSAAQILNQFIFGKSTFEPPTKLSSDKDDKNDEDAKLTERQKAFTKQRLDVASNDINARVNNTFRSTIDANIDPKQSMSDYVRKNASREALEELEKLISKDTRFKILTDRLWERAIEEDFAKPAVDRVRAAYISKAKTLLPSVIKKARAEALKGMGKRVSPEKDDTTTRVRKNSDDKEPSRSHSSDRKEEIPKGMTSLEFLMKED